MLSLQLGLEPNIQMIARVIVLVPGTPHMVQIVLVFLLDWPSFHKFAHFISLLLHLHLLRLPGNELVVATICLLLSLMYIAFVIDLVVELDLELPLLFHICSFLHLLHPLELECLVLVDQSPLLFFGNKLLGLGYAGGRQALRVAHYNFINRVSKLIIISIALLHYYSH